MIHTDIYDYFITYFEGQKYFIIFIDDFSHYDYVFLLHEKSEALKVFKVYKAEVENQLDRKIRVVKFDKSGEYYSRYDESDRNSRSFIKFLNSMAL